MQTGISPFPGFTALPPKLVLTQRKLEVRGTWPEFLLLELSELRVHRRNLWSLTLLLTGLPKAGAVE